MARIPKDKEKKLAIVPPSAANKIPNNGHATPDPEPIPFKTDFKKTIIIPKQSKIIVRRETQMIRICSLKKHIFSVKAAQINKTKAKTLN